jgi:hypothetical protein
VNGVVVTGRQAEYVAFVGQFEALMGVPPTEAEVAHYFGVAGASAHQMLAALERKGVLARLPRASRALVLNVAPDELPILAAPGHSARNPAKAWSTFGLYLAERLVARQGSAWVKVAPLLRLGAVLDDLLVAVGAKLALRRHSAARLKSLSEGLLAGDRATSPEVERAGRSLLAPEVAGAAPSPARSRPASKPVDPNQRTLF